MTPNKTRIKGKSRRFIVYLSVFFLLITSTMVSAKKSQKALTEPGKAPVVVMPENADIVTAFAAEELQIYLEKILKLNIKRVTESEFSGDSVAFHVGWTQDAQKAAPEAGNLKDDGFLLRRCGNTVFIVGSNKRGTLYGVYGLLEDHLGCRWPEPDPESEIVPQRTRLILAGLEDQQEPDLPVRGVMTAFGRRELTEEAVQKVIDFTNVLK